MYQGRSIRNKKYTNIRNFTCRRDVIFQPSWEQFLYLFFSFQFLLSLSINAVPQLWWWYPTRWSLPLLSTTTVLLTWFYHQDHHLHLVHFLCQDSVPAGKRGMSGGNSLVVIKYLDTILSFAGSLCSFQWLSYLGQWDKSTDNRSSCMF